MKRSNSDVTVIVPTLNEEEGIGRTLRELRDVLGDPFILVVDGNSADGTVRIDKEFEAEVMLQRRREKGLAVAQALGHIDSEPRYTVSTDADHAYLADLLGIRSWGNLSNW